MLVLRMGQDDVAVGRSELRDKTRISAALDRDRNFESAIEAGELIGLWMEHGEGAQLATDRNAL